MSELAPLETLYEAARGEPLPLPAALAALYGPLSLLRRSGAPVVLGNFVATLDGVVSLKEPGQSGGGPISGNNRHDRLVMGLLRAASDAVVVGAGTLKDVAQHVWTPAHVFPQLARAFDQLRAALGKQGQPLTVLVSGSGELDLGLPVFSAGQAPVLILTTEEGLQKLPGQLPAGVRATALQPQGHLSARAIVAHLAQAEGATTILSEGGPRLIGAFLDEGALDDLFLTVAPQIAGRARGHERPALVEGVSFAPERPLWGSLASVRRAESHLFLRYAFDSDLQLREQ
jgi:riboflavin biosynthesis pyrimidine reductase